MEDIATIRTQLDPERGAFVDLGPDTQPTTASLHNLPDKREPQASTFTALLSAHLCLVESSYEEL
jgi:hypothetical protein